MRFQDLFHSSRVLFAFPSRYWFTIGRSRVFSLGGWSPIFRQDFTCPALLVAHLVLSYCFRLQGYHPLWPHFPERSANNTNKECKAHPISLATTLGISVDFFSCGYLDVSVHRVRFTWPMYSAMDTQKEWVSPFGHLRIKARLPAPRSFRRLPRPSSPVIAKASTTCTCSLDPITSLSHRQSLQVEFSRCAVFQIESNIEFESS